MEVPVHPAPCILVAALTVLLTQVCWGRLDRGAVAHGQRMPTAEVQVIQTALTGMLASMAVYRGERVQAGQLLLEFDLTQARADADRAHTALRPLPLPPLLLLLLLLLLRGGAIGRKLGSLRRNLLALIAGQPGKTFQNLALHGKKLINP